MPKIVDHDQRRAQIIAAFLKLVEQEGLTAASSRALSSSMGISNGLLWRYFKDMNAIVESAYDQVVRQTHGRVDAALEGKVGMEAVYALIDELLPVTSVSKAEARIVAEYWHVQARAEASYLEGHDCWRAQLADLLGQARDRGEVAEDVPVTVIADAIMAIVGNAQVEYAMSGDDHQALAARDLARALVRLH
ncbi:TetR/AcrR family transcriptional regulator [Bifidobacterium cuniculi]|uniref:Putative TetR-family transcriptional regulator n=1 Tax=Bifidobacterium cuniculi TaxID=1688 RepID=A0A087AZJ8_9BIFI|nr:TetR/AcrR family transcriptional regulator [Bifidobacterium cuniculi]KFI64198.1 putative TetR-family transcriptional regulator [Bifidobacterium cuniculi]